MGELVRSLMAFAITVSGSFSEDLGYDTQLTNTGDFLPIVEFVSQEKLNEAFHGRKMDSYPNQVEALFMGGPLIYMKANVDLNSIRNQSHLLHEIVHYLQERSLLFYDCQGDKERMAFYIQEKWLEEKHGINFYDGSGIPVLSMVSQMSCKRPNLAKPWEAGP